MLRKHSQIHWLGALAEYSVAHCSLAGARVPACPIFPVWVNDRHGAPIAQIHPGALGQRPYPRYHLAHDSRNRRHVTTVPLLPDLSLEEMSINPLVSPSCHGDESDSDCQIQEGPKPGSCTALASDGLGQPRGTRPARRGEVETLQPSSIQPWCNLEWQRTLQVGKGLNNLNNTRFCNAVLQRLTHTAPLTNFCLDRGHSRRLGSTAATVAYDALLAVEKHVIEAFGSSQSSLSPIDIVTNLTKMGPHFAAGVQQDAHEFLRSLTANMHLADLRVGGSPHPHTQKHTNMLDGIFGGLLRSQVRCGLCLTDSVRYGFTFLDLSLKVHRPASVSEALLSFTDIDVLEGDNKYDCTVCKTKTYATKRGVHALLHPDGPSECRNRQRQPAD